jgi:hypothetical protein
VPVERDVDEQMPPTIVVQHLADVDVGYSASESRSDGLRSVRTGDAAFNELEDVLEPSTSCLRIGIAAPLLHERTRLSYCTQALVAF